MTIQPNKIGLRDLGNVAVNAQTHNLSTIIFIRITRSSMPSNTTNFACQESPFTAFAGVDNAMKPSFDAMF